MTQLTIGVSNNDLGMHINIIQPLPDGSAAIIYSAQAPKGDSFGQFDTVEVDASVVQIQARNEALEEAAKVCQAMYETGEGGAGCAVAADHLRALKTEAPATSAADAKDVAGPREWAKFEKFTIPHVSPRGEVFVLLQDVEHACAAIAASQKKE